MGIRLEYGTFLQRKPPRTNLIFNHRPHERGVSLNAQRLPDRYRFTSGGVQFFPAVEYGLSPEPDPARSKPGQGTSVPAPFVSSLIVQFGEEASLIVFRIMKSYGLCMFSLILSLHLNLHNVCSTPCCPGLVFSTSEFSPLNISFIWLICFVPEDQQDPLPYITTGRIVCTIDVGLHYVMWNNHNL